MASSTSAARPPRGNLRVSADARPESWALGDPRPSWLQPAGHSDCFWRSHSKAKSARARLCGLDLGFGPERLPRVSGFGRISDTQPLAEETLGGRAKVLGSSLAFFSAFISQVRAELVFEILQRHGASRSFFSCLESSTTGGSGEEAKGREEKRNSRRESAERAPSGAAGLPGSRSSFARHFRSCARSPLPSTSVADERTDRDTQEVLPQTAATARFRP